MTEMEFNFYILFSMFKQIGEKCNEWFYGCLIESGALKFYFSCITIYFFLKFLVRPIVGYSMRTGKSDMVKASKSKKES